MKIVIPGGSGQVGQILARYFENRGDEVMILSRRKADDITGRIVPWDGKSLGDWTSELDGADVLINMAGYTVNCRYHQANRERILNSRILSTRALRQAMQQIDNPPPVWLNASTATIYRHSLDKPMDEATGELGGGEPGSSPKWDFSIKVATEWEREFFADDLPGVRRVALRSAMTMSPDKGGVFDVMSGLVRVGLGGTNSHGRQYVSWIHDADFCAAIQFLLDHPEMDGPVNICSPNPMPNREFMRALRRAWGVPVGLPATRWMLEIGAIFLKTETELILKSRRVVPGRLLDAGFTFQHPDWPTAAQDLVTRTRK